MLIELGLPRGLEAATDTLAALFEAAALAAGLASDGVIAQSDSAAAYALWAAAREHIPLANKAHWIGVQLA